MPRSALLLTAGRLGTSSILPRSCSFPAPAPVPAVLCSARLQSLGPASLFSGRLPSWLSLPSLPFIVVVFPQLPRLPQLRLPLPLSLFTYLLLRFIILH